MGKKEKYRIDVDEDQCLDLEKEASSGIWQVVIKQNEQTIETGETPIEVTRCARAKKRELLETPFFEE